MTAEKKDLSKWGMSNEPVNEREIERKLVEYQAEQQIQQDIAEDNRKKNEYDWIEENLMDTLEDKAKHVILWKQSGILYNGPSKLLYQVIFAKKRNDLSRSPSDIFVVTPQA